MVKIICMAYSFPHHHMVFVRRVKIYPVAHVGIDSAVGGPLMLIEQLFTDMEHLRARFRCELTVLSSFSTFLDILHGFCCELEAYIWPITKNVSKCRRACEKSRK
jgi:hypothetical protein